MRIEQDIINILPLSMRHNMKNLSFHGLEEIRFRIGMPIELIYDVGNRWMNDLGPVNRWELDETLNYMTGYSYYAMEEELKNGYITMNGGHRVGLTGRANYSLKQTGENTLNGLTDIGGLNIRIAHEKKDCAKDAVSFIRNDFNVYNTLIFAPPGVGKTTYLRDLIRLLSYGEEKRVGLKVCVVDERSEIAACLNGVPQNDLGPRTDVLDGCPKEIGMRMVLRSMSPQVIAVDELGKKEEFDMLLKMRDSGVAVLGTMHGESVAQLNRVYQTSLCAYFERFIQLIRFQNGKRGYVIYDESGNRIWRSF